jgi:hypothetical protein
MRRPLRAGRAASAGRLLNPFGLAVLACLILGGWALWSGGILDGPIARQVRTSSVYAAPGTGLDRTAAERAIGNRRLVVVLLKPGADLSSACHGVGRAASGTMVLVLKRGTEGFDSYGCASFGGGFGQSFVAEQLIGEGIDGFADRPLDAVKVVVVNYDLLVKAGNVPDGARTISPSLPRYLVAIAALAAVLIGSAFVYLTGRRAGKAAAAREERLARADDDRGRAIAAAGVLAQRILDLDARPRSAAADRKFRRLAASYADLAGETGSLGTADLAARIEALSASAAAIERTKNAR